jgi:hypothetical protein
MRSLSSSNRTLFLALILGFVLLFGTADCKKHKNIQGEGRREEFIERGSPVSHVVETEEATPPSKPKGEAAKKPTATAADASSGKKKDRFPKPYDKTKGSSSKGAKYNADPSRVESETVGIWPPPLYKAGQHSNGPPDVRHRWGCMEQEDALIDKLTLLEWSVDDWDSDTRTFYPSATPALKKYISNDPIIVNETDVFIGWEEDEYFVYPTSLSVFKPTVIVDPGIFGPYDYSESISEWAWDTVLDGPSRYAVTIKTLGDEHIFDVLAIHDALRRNDNANISSLLWHQEFLRDGSALLFARFANLTDDKGNIYNLTGDTSRSASVRNVFSYLIFGGAPGNGTYGVDVVDFDSLFALLQGLVDDFAVDEDQVGRLNDIMDFIGWSVSEILCLDCPDPIFLSPWLPLFTEHQLHHTYEVLVLKNLYITNANSFSYPSKLADADDGFKKGDIMAKQLAAFFCAFMGTVEFFDKLFEPYGEDAYVTPIDLTDDYLEEFFYQMTRRWNEHHLHLFDAAKAAALDDYVMMYRTRVWLLDSCAFMANSIGNTLFRKFDILVRGRGLYNRLDFPPSPPPPLLIVPAPLTPPV